MNIRQWWWDKTHYEETFVAKLASNNGTFMSETMDIALKPDDKVLVRTLLPIENNSMSELVLFHEKLWYIRLKRVLRRM